jgi:hypothetical protein
VAEQVTVVLPNAKVEPEAGEQVAANTPSMLSKAEAAKVATAPVEPVASFVMSAGTDTTGLVVSCTVMVKGVPLRVFPAVSVAVQVTLVVPNAKSEPEAGEQVRDNIPLKASVADGAGVKVTAAPAKLVASTVIGPGTVIDDGCVLSIFMITETLADKPALLVAEQVSVTPVVVVSFVLVAGPQPLDVKMPDSASVTLQVTETLLLYQPFDPDVPVIEGIMIGDVLSEITPVNVLKQGGVPTPPTLPVQVGLD